MTFEPWSEAQLKVIRPRLSLEIRRVVVLGLETGQRLIDCVLMDLGQAPGDEVRVVSRKTGKLIDVFPSNELEALIAARCKMPASTTRIAIRAAGKPYAYFDLDQRLREELNDIGFPNSSFHGLGYAAAGRLEEAGCDVATITSVIGFDTYAMAVKYLTGRAESAKGRDARNRRVLTAVAESADDPEEGRNP